MGDNGWCYDYELNDQNVCWNVYRTENFVDKANINRNKYHQQWNAPHTSQQPFEKSPQYLIIANLKMTNEQKSVHFFDFIDIRHAFIDFHWTHEW